MKRALPLLLLLAGSPAPAETARVGFDDLPGLVKERNLHVSGARSQADAAGKLTGHLGRSRLPVIEAHAGGETFSTGPYPSASQHYGGLEASVNLFRSGRDLLEERAREAEARASEAGFEGVWLEELTKARRAYWNLVHQREVAALLRETLRRNEDNLGAARKRIAAGLATGTDRIEFEIYRVQLEQDLARVELGAANAQRTLNVLVGHAEDTALDTLEAVPHQHDDRILSLKLDPRAHRDVRATEARSEAASAAADGASRWWGPSLDLYAGYSQYTLREREYPARADRDEAVAGARLTFRLFDGLKGRSESASQRARAEGIAREAEQTARELSAHFEGSRQELRLMHDLVHAAEEAVEQGARYLKGTREEYARGVKNSPDVLSATAKLVELKTRHAELRRDYQHAKTNLLSLLGE